jgi:hypothetical protein
MTPWQTPLKKTPNKGGNKRTKKKTQIQTKRSRTQSGSLRGIKTNHVPKPTLISRSISKKKGGEFEKTISLKKPSPKMITHFKIEVT